MKNSALRFSTLLILTASFSVIVGVLVAGQNLQKILTLWGESMQVSVYLSENITPEAINQIRTSLQENEKLDRVQFVSSAGAVEQFRQQIAGFAPNLLNEADLASVIPASFQFALSSRVPAAEQFAMLEGVAQTLKNLPGVDEVSYGQDWVKNFSQVVAFVRYAGLLLAVIFIFAAVFMISNCLRSAVSQRKAEIEVLELLGASPHYIRKPFFVEAMGLCFISCSLALVASFLLFQSLIGAMREHLALVQMAEHFQFLKADGVFIVMISSLGVGYIASASVLRSLNDGWAASRRQKQREM
jgi:cell division transport system permease protein